METLTNLAITIPPLLIGYILGRNRDNNKVIFNKKLEIYSDIIYHINSVKYLRINLDVSTEKLRALIKKVDNLQENELINTLPHSHINKMEEDLDKKTSLLNYRDELIKLFAPARLIGSKEVVEELREYFSLISEYHSSEEKDDINNISNKILKSTMELEQLMRKDLGHFRNLSKHRISSHLRH